MSEINWVASVSRLIAMTAKDFPGVGAVVKQARALVPPSKREVAKWEAHVLCCIARRCNSPGALFLEIGTSNGYSAALIALSAPDAKLITLEPEQFAFPYAKEHLSSLPNVRVVNERSWDFLDIYKGPQLDFVFVDGTHKQVMRDFPWWNRLKIGGLILFHDYNPERAILRPCPHVWAAVNLLSGYMHPPEIMARNPGSRVAMAGFRRQAGEVWHGVDL